MLQLLVLVLLSKTAGVVIFGAAAESAAILCAWHMRQPYCSPAAPETICSAPS
jgi:hypothetical protein